MSRVFQLYEIRLISLVNLHNEIAVFYLKIEEKRDLNHHFVVAIIVPWSPSSESLPIGILNILLHTALIPMPSGVDLAAHLV